MRIDHAALRTYVHIERAQLVAELRPLQARVTEIFARLEELDKADALLEID
jgi:hypothetical protein